ncbi:MAG TPA: DNA translocase FtsK [Tepidiformaceae bacterium]
MTARTRPRPRTQPSRKARRHRTSLLDPTILTKPEVVGFAFAVAAVVGILFMVDVPAVLADIRDWLLQTLGLGLVVIAVLSLLGGYAVSRGMYLQGQVFVRKAAGAVAAGLFAWGAFGLNHADWTLGAVAFQQASLGGDIGNAITAGMLGKMAWLSLFVISAALLAPGLTRAFAVNAPRWVQHAWEERWFHNAASMVRRVVTFPFRHQKALAQDEPAPIGGTLRRKLKADVPEATDSQPVIYRPSAAPGTAALEAAVTRPAVVEPAIETPAPVEEEPQQPQQLGLALGGHSGWHLPAMELLHAPQVSTNRKYDNAARAQLIVDTLASFGVDATVVEINEGPTVTQFGVEPGWEVRYRDIALKDETGKTLLGPDGRPRTEHVEVGRTRVRVNKITALQNDLALALAAPSLRIEAPVPGRAIVGLEVPNDSATVVTLRHVMETKEFADLAKKSKLAVALGKGVSGVPVVADLAKMPHLLIAGATGSGKSVCMNAIIGGIMMNATPEEVRFIMIDPKRVELTPYSHIPFMAFSEVIVDMDKVVGTLQAVVSEMEARYKKFAAVAVRNIEAYNRHPRILKKVPYWVVIVDELADLMMAAPFEVEKLLCRLAQLARATGIHLVVATQRPSVDVVTGLIKANFPTRIAFAVTSMTDSRTILDMGGAEKLLGRGDMLYMPTDVAKPIRIQGVYVSDPEIERLVAFWTDERFSEIAPEKADNLLEEALIAQNGNGDIDVDPGDPLYEKAKQLTGEHQRISPSLFQRRLKVGYVKAQRIVEMLEAEGLVGPREDGESRRVLTASGSGED